MKRNKTICWTFCLHDASEHLYKDEHIGDVATLIIYVPHIRPGEIQYEYRFILKTILTSRYNITRIILFE